MPLTPLNPVTVNRLTTLGQLVDDHRQQLVLIRECVAECRMHNASWAQIGLMLGMSTQGAWERFRPPDAPKPLPGQGSLFHDKDRPSDHEPTSRDET